MTTLKFAVVGMCGAVLGCGHVAAEMHDSGVVDDDAPPASGLQIKALPSSFILHVNDTRDTVVSVTNNSDQPLSGVSLDVVGLALGTLTFTSNTCTTTLAPGASCMAMGRLTATTAGTADFNVSATATPVPSGMAALSINAMPACAMACGPSGTANCCASAVVPGNAPGATLAGTAFYRDFDAANDGMHADMSYPATVSDFRLDTYEVTVARFRAFVAAGKGVAGTAPASGAGGRKLNGMANQAGWDTAWNGSLQATTSALTAALKCDAPYYTWTDTPGANENRPINCVTWYEAMAFCIWDGGFLPTNAEWSYAASGGSEQRAYPWSNPPGSVAIDATKASYSCLGDGTSGCAMTDFVRVGSKTGDGRWGHADLAGNAIEWIVDSYRTPYATAMCNDCADLGASAGDVRTYRSGGFSTNETTARTTLRGGEGAPIRFGAGGVRCARVP